MILTFNGKFMSRGQSKVLGYESTPPTPDPYNPLNLPTNTVRVRTNDGNPPTKYDGYTTYETATLVSGTSDVYDVYKSGTSFAYLLYGPSSGTSNVLEVLGANTRGITIMGYMFQYCSSLTAVALFDTSSVTGMWNMFGACTSLTNAPLFDTSSVTNMQSMFIGCSQLTSVPLYNTSNVTNMQTMFNSCINVESGALALYQQASSQANPPSQHRNTFSDCGSNTTTGFNELIQIPSSWGGWGS